MTNTTCQQRRFRVLERHRTGRHAPRRALFAEVLERRDLLSADALCPIGTGPLADGLQAGGPSPQQRGGPPDVVPPVQAGPAEPGTTVELSPFEMDSLLHMREEEKLARDVYLTLANEWSASLFTNIARSESQHMTAMQRLLDRYDVADPVGDNGVGEFTDPAFETLYGQLVDQGSQSLQDAYQVGARIEELDIVDLQQALDTVQQEAIARVYESLLRGSRNHLRAFAGAIAASGETYDAQHLTQEDFDAIAQSPRETANGRGLVPGPTLQRRAGEPMVGHPLIKAQLGVREALLNRLQDQRQVQQQNQQQDQVPREDCDNAADPVQDRLRQQATDSVMQRVQQQARDTVFAKLGSATRAGKR